MEIAVLSDTHSRNETVAKALRVVRERGVETLLHCGDIEDADTVGLFAGFKVHFVWGNCDVVERSAMRQAIQDLGASVHEPFADLELEGVKIAFLHGDDRRLLRDVERSGHYDYLFYGHSHQAEVHRTGPTQVINPGALHRARPKTFFFLDLATRKVEWVVVDP